MSILGNILWFICGGLLSGLSWVLAGCLWCISIIGIPMAVGRRAFFCEFKRIGRKDV